MNCLKTSIFGLKLVYSWIWKPDERCLKDVFQTNLQTSHSGLLSVFYELPQDVFLWSDAGLYLDMKDQIKMHKRCLSNQFVHISRTFTIGLLWTVSRRLCVARNWSKLRYDRLNKAVYKIATITNFIDV
jgi:hypothetical protein